MRAVGIIFSNIHDKSIPELSRIRTLGSVPYGGRYRLIDFPLSNMVNSGIDTEGIITKSNYQSLMDHVGSGKDWDLARKDGGVIILPPYGNMENSTLYNSRLEALKGITNFLFRADEDYVVMTDCDAGWRIDYGAVIDFHIKNQADITLVYKGFYAGITSIQSYYDSSLALLDKTVRDEIFGDRSVFTKIRDSAPTKYGNAAVVKNSMIADGCTIEGEVENSILFRNVKVGRGSVVRNSIVMQNTVLGENCTLDAIITDKNVTITDRKTLSGSSNHPFYIGKGIMI